MSGDVWGSTSVTVARSVEAMEELVRCGACRKPFRRPKVAAPTQAEIKESVADPSRPDFTPVPLETARTHRQVDPDVTCPVDASVEPFTKASQWRRK